LDIQFAAIHPLPKAAADPFLLLIETTPSKFIIEATLGQGEVCQLRLYFSEKEKV
jgi:hypothetical protein